MDFARSFAILAAVFLANPAVSGCGSPNDRDLGLVCLYVTWKNSEHLHLRRSIEKVQILQIDAEKDLKLETGDVGKWPNHKLGRRRSSVRFVCS